MQKKRLPQMQEGKKEHLEKEKVPESTGLGLTGLKPRWGNCSGTSAQLPVKVEKVEELAEPVAPCIHGQ